MLFVATPIVEVVRLEKDLVVLISKQKLTVGSEIRVKAWLGEKGMEHFQQLVDFKVAIRTARPTESGKWTSVGWLSSQLPFEPVLVGVESAVLRKAQRRVCRFRVVSPDLPDFCGMSLDISSTGMQLESRGELRLGSLINLRLETNMTDWTTVNFKARVAWHAKEGTRVHRLGVEFVQLSPDSRDKLAQLERYLEVCNAGTVLQSTLACADQFLVGRLAASSAN